ncbi:MAG: TonB-dependent receptor, partial [Bryobacteraceae bacterium]
QAAGFITISPSNVQVINHTLDSTGYRGPRIETGEFSTGWDTTNYFARLDHQMNPANQLIVRYSLYDIRSDNARSVGALNAVSRGTRSDDRDHAVALSTVSSLSPSAINEGRFQFTDSRLSAPGNDLIGPAVSIAGVANFGASTSSPVGRDNVMWELSDSLSLQQGRHFFKAGFNYIHNRLNIFFPGSQVAGVYNFPSLARFQTGEYTTFQQAFGELSQAQSNPNLGFFAQDEWRLNQQVTVHLGLRYDLQFLPSPIRTDRNNLAPRVGISFAPGDRKTVIRASYGMYFDRIPLRATSNALQRDGSKYRVALVSFGQPGAPVFPQQLSSFPAGQYISITTIDPNIENSYAHQASFQVEREVGSALSLSAGYQWTRSLHLILSRNANVPAFSAAEANARGVANLGRPDSRFGNVSRYESAGDSYFNGLMLSIKARPARWSHLRLSYTYSKAIDDVGNFFFSSPQNNFDLRDDRGLSDNDQRHRLNLSAVLESRSGSPLLRGWQLSPMFQYNSPLPFNVLTQNDRNNDTNINDRRVGVGRNTGIGFDYASLDVRLSRVFRFGESWTLQGLGSRSIH